jgi:hypothetical protein
MGPPSLSTIMERVRQQGRPWSSPQELGVDRTAVMAAWMASDDPFAMLLLLGAIYPDRHEPACEALVASMSFFSPMQREGEKQTLSRGTYNGPNRFRFVHVAQRVRQGLAEVPEPERSRVALALSDAIRSVVSDPHALAAGAPPGAE